MSNPRKIDSDYLVFNKKKFLGKHIVEFKCLSDSERVYDVSTIKDIYVNDFGFAIKTESGCGVLHPHDHDALEIVHDEDNILIYNHILAIKYIILLK